MRCCCGVPSPPVPPAPLSGLRFAWFVRDDEPFSPLTQQGDDSGNGLVISSTAGLQPPWNAAAVNGLAGATFVGGQFFSSSYADDFSFAHKAPSSGALYVNVVPGGLPNQIVFRTRNAAGPGILLIWNGALATFSLLLVDAAAATVLLLTGAAPGGGNRQVSWRISSTDAATGPRAAAPVAELFIDGVLAASGPLALPFSTAAAATPLLIGTAAGYAGVNNLTNGAVRWFVLADRRWRDDEIATMFATRDTLVSPRTLFSPWMMGDSITQFTNAYRRWLDARCRATPNLFKLGTGTQNTAPNIPGYDPFHDGIAGQTLQQMIARTGAALVRAPNCKIVLAGSNNLSALPPTPGPTIALLQQLVDAMNAAQPGPCFHVAIPRGDGTLAGYNAVVDAYNIALRAGPIVNSTFVDIYGPADATSPGTADYAYANATCAVDGIGHPTAIGGVVVADNIADVIGQNAGAFGTLRGD